MNTCSSSPLVGPRITRSYTIRGLSGGTGRRRRLKISRRSPGVWVRFPPLAPMPQLLGTISLLVLGLGLGPKDHGPSQTTTNDQATNDQRQRGILFFLTAAISMTRIGPSFVISGELHSSEDTVIEGRVDGHVRDQGRAADHHPARHGESRRARHARPGRGPAQGQHLGQRAHRADRQPRRSKARSAPTRSSSARAPGSTAASTCSAAPSSRRSRTTGRSRALRRHRISGGAAPAP